MDCNALLNEFQIVKVLLVDTQTKSLVLLGKINSQDAIVTFEKTAFSASLENNAQFKLQSILESTKLINHNDIYFWSMGLLVQDLDVAPGTKVNLIYPATEKHIRKYETQKLHMVRESAEMYEQKVAPFVETQKGDRIQWVYNIIFKDKESESFVHNNTDPQNGFVLLPDMKWDQKTMNALYLVAIVRRTDISSVRDLNSSHIEYLEGILNKIKEATCEAFVMEEDELRVFVHYQPSYYHFHIHVVNVAHPGLGSGLNVGKAILLDDIIDNLKLCSDYYQRKTLTYHLGELHPLWEILKN